jgi:cbb3-type cytochrome oxidase cytochrome c subunit
MNYGALIFLGVFATLLSSWCGLVLAPYFQLGRQEPVEIKSTGVLYPPARPGQAAQGREVYVAAGCVYCHSQQVRQRGVELGVTVKSWGTNTPAVVEALRGLDTNLNHAATLTLLAEAPYPLLQNTTLREANAALRKFEKTGAEVLMAPIKPVGPDIARGWGQRRSVAQDYLRDQPLQLGSQRIGPDLANYGARQTNAMLIAKHLLNPQSFVPGSVMPPYRFLFDKRKLAAGEKVAPGAILETEGGVDYEYVPTADAQALVSYLLSLRADETLFETPVAKPPAVEVAAAATTTNAPAK